MDKKILGFIIVGVIALLAGRYTLHGELVSDDFVLMEAAERVGIVKMFTANWLGERGEGGFYRPVALASWKLDRLIYGRNPAGYHLTNLLLHLTVSLMVFQLISRFHGSMRIPLAAALLFAVHPVHVEAVAWLSGRSDTVATFFYLFSLLLFFKTPREHARVSGTGVTALISGICAMLSKEIAYTLPVALLAMNHLPAPRTDTRRIRRSSTPYFGALVVILILRYLAVGSVLGGSGPGGFLRLDKIIFKNLTFYTQWLLEPFSLPGAPSALVWTILILSGILVSIAAMFSAEHRPGIIWFWITVLPALNICRAQHLYLPSIGLFWFAAILLFDDRTDNRSETGEVFRGIAWTVLIVVFLMHTWEKNREWSGTGRIGKGIGDTLKLLQPAPPPETRFVFINPPVNTRLNIGVFQNGVREAVRLWYGDSSLDGVRFVTLDQYTEPRPEKDSVWLFDDGRISRLSDADPRSAQTGYEWPGFITPVVFPDNGPIALQGMDKQLSGVIVQSQLANADALETGVPVAEILVDFDDGRRETHLLLAGKHTAEWAYDREDIRSRVRHARAPVAYSYLTGTWPEPPVPGHMYRGMLMFDMPGKPAGMQIRPVVDTLNQVPAGPGSAQIQLEIRGLFGVP